MIYKYLLEIKYRIFFSLIAWCFMVANCYYFKETLLYVFIRLSSSYGSSGSFYFLTTNVTEVFMTYVHLTYFITNQVGVIFVCYQIFIFISTGLYKFEYIYLKNVLTIVIICWMIFILLLNIWIFPASWFFFSKFQNFLSFQGLAFYFEAKLNEYLIFYKSIYYLCYLIYQIIVLFFIFLDLFKTNLLIIKKLRKILYFAFFLFATCVTPPEVVYQLITSICIIVVYELFIIHIILKLELTNFK